MITKKPSEADLIIQKLPSDMGIHRNPRKGTLNAPGKILEDYSSENNVMIDEVFPNEFSLQGTLEKIEENTREINQYSNPILSLGGDHSVSFPVIKALKDNNPGMKLVWLDAHLDLKEKVGDHVSHDVVVRELLKNGFSEDEIYFVGITEIDHDEEEFIQGRDLTIYRYDELEEFKREFKNDEQPVYLSADIDVLKEELAPGTGYPDGKLDMGEVQSLIQKLGPEHADLVEVAPSLDDGTTLENSRKVLNFIEKELK